MSKPLTETSSEINRRERRAVALSALNHLLSVAIKTYPDDRHSQQDLVDAFHRVSHCIGEFESEANDAFRDGQASCAPWMQHHDLCPAKFRISLTPEERDAGWQTKSDPCSCGLTAHLAKGGTT